MLALATGSRLMQQTDNTVVHFAGSIAGAVAVATVGALYKATGSWSTALVGPMIGLYVLGALFWSRLVVNKPQNFQQGSMQASS